MADLSKYSNAELHGLKKDIDKQIAQRRKDEAKKARDELKAVADRYGFNLNELVSGQGGGTATHARDKGANAKFRHPNDGSKTWSGRGRKPVWIKEWEGAGRSLDDLRVA